jgi:formate--tetrahydrofolate ligase
VVALNDSNSDPDAEHALPCQRIGRVGVAMHTTRHWAEGGKDALSLAHEVVVLCEQPSTLRFTYDNSDTLWDKLRNLATRTYGAAEARANAAVRAQIQRPQDSEYGRFAVCVVKTLYSFSTDATQTRRAHRPYAGRARSAARCGCGIRGHGLPAT